MLRAINLIDLKMAGHADAALAAGKAGVYTAKRLVVGIDLTRMNFAFQAGVQETDYQVASSQPQDCFDRIEQSGALKDVAVQISALHAETEAAKKSAQCSLLVAWCDGVAEKSAQVAGLVSWAGENVVNGLHIALFSKMGKAYGLLGGFKTALGNLVGLYLRGEENGVKS